jgi:hypothetical protein
MNRHLAPLLSLCSLMLAGCIYDVPLEPTAKLPVDKTLAGLWETMPEPTSKPPASADRKPPERMRIIQFSDTEYLVHYPACEDGFYFKAHAIRVGGIDCVQIQWLGTAEDGTNATKEQFHVTRHTLKDGILEIMTLNEKLIPRKSAPTTEKLRECFIANKDKPDLFKDPIRFRRVEAANPGGK